MTTIAISDGEVAADTQATSHNYSCHVQKVWRLPCGGVAAGCGDLSAAYAGIRWLMDGEKGDGPDIDGALIVIVRNDHTIWIAEERWPAFPILDRTYAAGCGRDLARQLMAQGKSPVQAVAEACQLDAMSSGPVLAMTVRSPMDTEPQTFAVDAARAAPSRKARK